MRNLLTPPRIQQGATLIVALVFLLVLTIAGVTAMRFSTFEERMASNTQFRNQVFQQAQNELRAQLLAFNTNLANRVPLQLAIGQPEDPNASNLGLPLGSKTPVTGLASLTGTQITGKTVRFTQEKICDDGSSVTEFTCLYFELNTVAELASGTSSSQTQGITFQNNK